MFEVSPTKSQPPTTQFISQYREEAMARTENIRLLNEIPEGHEYFCIKDKPISYSITMFSDVTIDFDQDDTVIGVYVHPNKKPANYY